MKKTERVTKSSSPLRPQNLKKQEASQKASEGPSRVVTATEPTTLTRDTMEILKSFDKYDYVRICALPITDLGIPNPADMWAKNFDDLADKCKSELIDEEGELKDYWVKMCNYLQDSTTLVVPEVLAVSLCKMAGWKAFLREANGLEVD